MQGGQTGPRSFGQVLDGAFSIYTRRFVPLAKIAAAIFLPLAAAVFVLDLWASSPIGFAEADPDDLLRLDGEIMDSTRIYIDLAATAILNGLGMFLVVAAALRAASQAYLGDPVDVGRSLGFAFRRFPSLLWLLLLLAIFIGIPAVFFFFFLPAILAIYLTIVWILSMPALVLEDKRGFKALGRSNQLIKDFWWRTVGLLIVVGVFTAIVGGLIPGLITSGFEGVADDNFALWLALQNIVSAIGLIITAPLWAATITVMYYDLRVRKEGFDVEMMVRQLAEPGSEGPPSSAESLGSGSGTSRPPPPAPAA